MFYIIIGIIFLNFLFFGDSFFSFEGLFDLHGVQFHKNFLGEIAILPKIILICEISLVIPGLNASFLHKSKKILLFSLIKMCMRFSRFLKSAPYYISLFFTKFLSFLQYMAIRASSSYFILFIYFLNSAA